MSGVEAVAWQYRDMRPDGVQVGVWRDIAEDLHGSYLFGGIISGVPWVDWEVRALYSQATIDTLRAQLEAAAAECARLRDLIENGDLTPCDCGCTRQCCSHCGTEVMGQLDARTKEETK